MQTDLDINEKQNFKLGLLYTYCRI